MKVEELPLAGAKVLHPPVYGDDRGFFLELYQSEKYADAGLPKAFFQDNLSKSQKGVLRGLHFQHPHPQGKLVTVLMGRVLDVIVDLRPESKTFGEHAAVELDGSSKRQLWVPPGFAHGFLTLEENTLFHYKCSTPYRPEFEHSLKFDDPALQISWPSMEYLLSEKDKAGRSWDEITRFLES